MPAELYFCFCNSDYADPECGTERKSQLSAYMFSLFLGPFGADLFYLGYPVWGSLKFASLGGVGLWWAYDVIRVGSAPVLAGTGFRVRDDLPHWAFVLSAVFFMLFIGFSLAVRATLEHVRKKRKDALLIQAEDAFGKTNLYSTSNTARGLTTQQVRGHGDMPYKFHSGELESGVA